MIIERYQRRESSVEEALIEMYLASISVRRVEERAGYEEDPVNRFLVEHRGIRGHAYLAGDGL